MRRRLPPAILSAAAGLVLLWHAGGSDAQPIPVAGPDADVTEEGLHRVDPSIMEAAWVRPDLDLSRYERLLLMPTAVQFREVDEGSYDAHSRSHISEFPLNDEKKAWLSGAWRQAVDARFVQQQSYELYDGAGANVLVVQGFLVDVVSRIPPDTAGSNFTLVTDPWVANVVLELRDGTTGELLARTIDRRTGEGQMDVVTIWVRTEVLMERWADVLADRLEQLADLGGPGGRSTPTWAR